MAFAKTSKSRITASLVKFSSDQAAIIKTLAYSDIFHFPLRKEELWNFLTSDKKISKHNFEKALQSLHGRFISEKGGYFCIKGQEKIINRRKNNLPEIARKMVIAKKTASHISWIPTILFVGISGSLAMGDAKRNDDIDFFLITKKDTLFKTRFYVLLLLQFLGVRRKRSETIAADKVCVNFLIDETKLAFPKERHDVYTAHEILQIIPLFDKNNTYARLFQSNSWMKVFFPNIIKSKFEITKIKLKFSQEIFKFVIHYLSPEWVFRLIQSKYMKMHITEETISEHVLAFNPYDYRVQTLKKLKLKLQELGLLTMN